VVVVVLAAPKVHEAGAQCGGRRPLCRPSTGLSTRPGVFLPR
jgi:hypothetical protein